MFVVKCYAKSISFQFAFYQNDTVNSLEHLGGAEACYSDCFGTAVFIPTRT